MGNKPTNTLTKNSDAIAPPSYHPSSSVLASQTADTPQFSGGRIDGTKQKKGGGFVAKGYGLRYVPPTTKIHTPNVLMNKKF